MNTKETSIRPYADARKACLKSRHHVNVETLPVAAFPPERTLCRALTDAKTLFNRLEI